MTAFRLNINGEIRELEGPADMPLLWALRDVAGLPGTKYGCGRGLCGACTVHIDGRATRSCQVTLEVLTPEQRITTIEGLSDAVGRAVQQAWITHQVPQCGYCQSGQVMAATALLSTNPAPTDGEIDAHMAGNLCRCGTYQRIRVAIHTAASAVKDGPAVDRAQGSSAS